MKQTWNKTNVNIVILDFFDNVPCCLPNENTLWRTTKIFRKIYWFHKQLIFLDYDNKVFDIFIFCWKVLLPYIAKNHESATIFCVWQFFSPFLLRFLNVNPFWFSAATLWPLLGRCLNVHVAITWDSWIKASSLGLDILRHDLSRKF
jgi:hypothetical protein